MAVEAGLPVRAAPLQPIPLLSRFYGLGSIYGKTIRDSRLAVIIAAGLFGGLSLVLGAAIGTVFPTPAARREVDQLVGSMPASMVNLFGNATLMGPKLGTLGGYMSWKYGALFGLGAGLWSILALSGTLAGEAARGSLDFVAAAPFGKRRIALEKLAAHLTMLCLAMAVIAVMVFVSSNVFGHPSLGDPIPLGGPIGVALWVASGLDIGGPLVAVSPFHWTVNHVPLVGFYDWTGVAAVGVVAVIFLVIGVELFRRRDLGVTAGLSLPALPKDVLGVRGPVARAFGDQLPRALAWGLGMGVMGALLASLVGSFANQVGTDTTIAKTFATIFPGYDFATAGGGRRGRPDDSDPRPRDRARRVDGRRDRGRCHPRLSVPRPLRRRDRRGGLRGRWPVADVARGRDRRARGRRDLPGRPPRAGAQDARLVPPARPDGTPGPADDRALGPRRRRGLRGHRGRRDPAGRVGGLAPRPGLMEAGTAATGPWAERAVVVGSDGVARCAWGVEGDPLYRAYHDAEWGRPSRDERHLFEMLVLEGAQAGLSWSTILRKREGYRRAFAGFDVSTVAAFGEEDVARR